MLIDGVISRKTLSMVQEHRVRNGWAVMGARNALAVHS